MAAGPISRILSAGLLRQDGHSSGPRIAARLKRPTRKFDAPSRHVLRRTRGPSLFGLAPCGVCPARHITAAAVRSYRTFSPLPGTRSKAGLRRYVFCGTFRRMDLNPPSRTLSGTLLYGVRTFLPRRWTQRERPSGPAANTSLYSMGLQPTEVQVAGQTMHNSRGDSRPRLSGRAIARLFSQSEKCGASLRRTAGGGCPYVSPLHPFVRLDWTQVPPTTTSNARRP